MILNFSVSVLLILCKNILTWICFISPRFSFFISVESTLSKFSFTYYWKNKPALFYQRRKGIKSSRWTKTRNATWGANNILQRLSPGQTGTCIDLHPLWPISNSCASRRKFSTIWPTNPSQHKLSHIQVERAMVTFWSHGTKAGSLEMVCFVIGVFLQGILRVHLATQFKSLCKLNLQLLVIPFGHSTQDSTQAQLAATCESIRPLNSRPYVSSTCGYLRVH